LFITWSFFHQSSLKEERYDALISDLTSGLSAPSAVISQAMATTWP
jgi:hypothetical protein